MASAPRKIFRLPIMWAMTKPTSAMPVTAITTFLPTTVPHSTTAGLLDHTRRDFLTGAGFARFAALPLCSWVAIGFLLGVVPSVSSLVGRGPAVLRRPLRGRDPVAEIFGACLGRDPGRL